MTDNVTTLEGLVAQEQALEAQEAAIQVQEQALEAQEAALLKTMETPAPPAPAPVPVPAPPAPTPPAPVPVPVPPAPSPASPVAAIPAIIDGPFMMSVIGVNVGAIFASTAVASMPIFDPTTKSGGNLIPAMGTTGAHPEIGFITGDAMMALGSNMDAHAVASVRSTADCSVNWPIHITDKTTGEMPAKPWLNAKESFNGDTSNLLNDAQTNPNALAPDVAHQPHFIYLTAMHCLLKKDPGFAKYLKELKAWVSWNFFTGPTQTRGPTGVEGIINPEASAYQPRGEGWGPAALYQCYHVMNVANTYGLPFEDDGWYAWCKQAVENNIHYLEHKYHLGDYDESYAVPYYNVPTGWAKNDFGLLQFPMDVMSNGAIGYGKGADGKTVVVGAFMQAFQSWVVMWLAKMGPKMDLSATAKAELASLATWAGKWPVMLFGDSTDPNAWPWPYAGMYTINLGAWNADGSVTYAKNGGAMFALNGQPRPTGTAFLNHDTTNVADQFLDYYVANIWPALVYANDFGIAGSNAAVARMIASDQWKAGPVFAPAFAVMTRGKKFPVANTPVTTPPVTTPPSSPPAAPAPTTPTTTPPAAPAPGPAAPAPTAPTSTLPDFGSAGYTIEEKGDDHIPLPGPIVDPSTWAPDVGQGKSMPMLNTLLDALPDWYKPIANSDIDNWPGFAWLKGLQGLWGLNGGHQVMEANYAGVLFPKCLMWQARNYGRTAVTIADAEAGLDQGPDDVGAGDLMDAMHGYGGILARDGDLGVGDEAVVYATNYRGDGTTNDIHMVDPKVLNGGGWAMYAKGLGIPLGNYAQAAVSRRRKGFFIGDSRVGTMYFVPFDPNLPWSEVASVIPQWTNGTMLVDDDRGIIIGICGAVDPYYDPTLPAHANKLNTSVLVRDLMDDAGAVTGFALDVTTNPIVGLNLDGVTAEFEPDRCGIKYVPGGGFFGVKKTSAGGRYVHFDWKDQANWQAGVTPVAIWDVGVDVPIPINDVYGSFSVEQHFKDIEVSVLAADHPIRNRWFAINPVNQNTAPFIAGLPSA